MVWVDLICVIRLVGLFDVVGAIALGVVIGLVGLVGWDGLVDVLSGCVCRWGWLISLV